MANSGGGMELKMKSISLIHTVKSVLNTFEQKLQEGVKEEIKVHNLLDDYLTNNPNEIGYFSIENRNRLLMDIKAAELTGADIIITTCSTLTPTVDLIRPFIKVPLIAIDDAMLAKGVTYGNKVMVMATAMSTIAPTMKKLMEEAVKAGKEVSLDSVVYHEAFVALKKLDMNEHDMILKERAKEIQGYDCIILAQASMAHLEKEISEICHCPVLSSIRLCIQQVDELLKKVAI